MRIAVMLVALLPVVAQALEPGPSSKSQAQTEAWLRVQARNEQASPTPQTQTPKERDESMKRWMETYKYAIPAMFKWESMGASDK